MLALISMLNSISGLKTLRDTWYIFLIIPFLLRQAVSVSYEPDIPFMS